MPVALILNVGKRMLGFFVKYRRAAIYKICCYSYCCTRVEWWIMANFGQEQFNRERDVTACSGAQIKHSEMGFLFTLITLPPLDYRSLDGNFYALLEGILWLPKSVSKIILISVQFVPVLDFKAITWAILLHKRSLSCIIHERMNNASVSQSFIRFANRAGYQRDSAHTAALLDAGSDLCRFLHAHSADAQNSNNLVTTSRAKGSPSVPDFGSVIR